MNLKSLAALTLAASAAPLAIAGPISYAACVAGCNAVAASCYGATGVAAWLTWLTVFWVPPAIQACNTAHGTCLAVCTAIFFAPTP